jgi:hypothetical protein
LCERMESIASQNAFWNCCQERENPAPDWAICIKDNVL